MMSHRADQQASCVLSVQIHAWVGDNGAFRAAIEDNNEDNEHDGDATNENGS